jgi:TolB-like protein
MSNFFEELKNRNVYKVATAYALSGWLIIQVVNTLGPNLNWPDSIPSIVTKILLVGFPIALVLTWLYEFTPQGLLRTGTVQEDTDDNRKASRRLNRVIIGTLAFTLCFMLVERVFFAERTSINEYQKASIAVLPFMNMSSEKENEYFADGLTESILDKLAQLSGMQVTARTSSFKFKGKNEDVRDIGQQLSVNYILEGSVQYDRRSNRIRITAQLINVGNGYHLWSDTFEDDFDEVFRIQEDVSRKVASKLRVQLLPEEEKALTAKLTENTDAYKLYLKARTFSAKRDDKNLEQAISLLNQALEIDPEFAEAHAELSFLYPQRFFYGNLSKEVRDERMDFHLKKALSIAPNKPEVLKAEASYHLRLRIDSSKAISNLRKAIELKPNYADAHYALFQALGWAKQMELGVKSLERAVELDPLNFFASTLAMKYYYNYHDHKKAFAILDNVIKSDSTGRAAREKAKIIASEPYGDLVEAFKLIHKGDEMSPYSLGNLIYHTLFPLNLDLAPISEKYGRQMQMRFPDNEWMFLNISFLHSFKKEYNKRKEWVEFWIEEKDLDNKEVAREIQSLNVELGNYSVALRTFEEAFPELVEKEITAEDLEYLVAEDFSLYIELLRYNKLHLKANVLSEELCDFYKEQVKNDSLMPPSVKYEITMDCYYLSNDTLNFLNTLEERFFIKKDRLGIFSNIKAGRWKRFENNSAYQALVKKITKETHRMRAGVIEYLKEEGDWDPAWDKELGLE